jgi:hypothetical protein
LPDSVGKQWPVARSGGKIVPKTKAGTPSQRDYRRKEVAHQL